MKNISVSLIVILFVSFPFSAKALVCGQIATMRGEVEVLRVKAGEQNKENPVRTAVKGKESMKLTCTDIVVTRGKSRAKIRFNTKAAMTLGPNTRIAVAKYAKETGDPSLLNLTYGKIRVLFDEDGGVGSKAAGSGGGAGKKKKTLDIDLPKKLPKKKSGSPSAAAGFEVKTPTAVVGVRGTDFFVSFEPNVRITEQATIDGEVVVEQKGTGEKVLVPKGSQVSVEDVTQPRPKKKAKEDDEDEEEVAQASQPKALKVKPIAPQIVEEIRQTSAIAKVDKDFTHEAAVEVLGPPEQWTPPKDELPFDLKDLKEEF